MIKEDLIFNNEKLYFRKKISHFSLEKIDSLCLYFRTDESFFVSSYLDFLSIDSNEILTQIKEILSKELITLNDISHLIIIFGNYENQLTLNESLIIARELFGSKNLNEMYFSV